MEEQGGGMNRALVGRRYEGEPMAITPEQVEAYADATEDRNPHYRLGHAVATQGVSSDGQRVPPLFGAYPLHRLAERVILDPELRMDVFRLVHGEQDMTFLRSLRPGETLHPRAQLRSIEAKVSGEVAVLEQELHAADGCVLRAVSHYFVRAPRPAPGSDVPARPHADLVPASRGPLLGEAWCTLAPEASAAFADASGDHNPIHTDDEIARAVGLPGRIGHGMHTMAFAQRVVIDTLLGGDPRRLLRLALRFARPVFPGDTLHFTLWDAGTTEEGASRVAIEVSDPRGQAVVSKAWAACRA